MWVVGWDRSGVNNSVFWEVIVKVWGGVGGGLEYFVLDIIG